MQQWQKNKKKYQYQIAEFFHLHASLERQLKLTSFDDNVWEVKQMDLKGI